MFLYENLVSQQFTMSNAWNPP